MDVGKQRSTLLTSGPLAKQRAVSFAEPTSSMVSRALCTLDEKPDSFCVPTCVPFPHTIRPRICSSAADIRMRTLPSWMPHTALRCAAEATSSPTRPRSPTSTHTHTAMPRVRYATCRGWVRGQAYGRRQRSRMDIGWRRRDETVLVVGRGGEARKRRLTATSMRIRAETRRESRSPLSPTLPSLVRPRSRDVTNHGQPPSASANPSVHCRVIDKRED